MAWEQGPPVLIGSQFIESEDSEDEANLAAVKVRGPLTDIATEDVLVPQIPNKGSHVHHDRREKYGPMYSPNGQGVRSKYNKTQFYGK